MTDRCHEVLRDCGSAVRPERCAEVLTAEWSSAIIASMVEGEEAGAEMSMVSLELRTAESHFSPAPVLS